MLRSAKELKGVAIQAHDGQIGSVSDLYFDDDTWLVRYYVVDTGGFLPGRKVLIPAAAILQSRVSDNAVRVDLTAEQVRNSPYIDVDRPISRQAEATLYNYYGWPFYWEAPSLPNLAPVAPAVEPLMSEPPEIREQRATEGQYGGDPHLRSAHEVTGYHVRASDGEIGHVVDFLVDEAALDIRYIVVATRNWLPGKKVLVPPGWIREVKWSESKVFVAAPRQAIQRSPEYRPGGPIPLESEAPPQIRRGGGAA